MLRHLLAAIAFPIGASALISTLIVLLRRWSKSEMTERHIRLARQLEAAGDIEGARQVLMRAVNKLAVRRPVYLDPIIPGIVQPAIPSQQPIYLPR